MYKIVDEDGLTYDIVEDYGNAEEIRAGFEEFFKNDIGLEELKGKSFSIIVEENA